MYVLKTKLYYFSRVYDCLKAFNQSVHGLKKKTKHGKY